MQAPKISYTNTRYGRMAYHSDDKFIGHALEKYGEYSEAEPNLWRKIVSHGDTVIDIGANIGALTLALSDMVGTKGKVMAFEPQPDNYKLLLENVIGKNVYTFGCALGAEEGQIAAPALAALGHANYGGIELGSGTHKVSVYELDHITEPPHHEPVSFIKIDVEGMEGEVLKGAKQTIVKNRPVLYVENDRKEKSEELLQLIFGMNYFVFEHKPLLYSAHNFKEAEVDENNIISINLLCIPKEKISKYGKATEGLKRIREEPPVRPTISTKKWACIVRLGGIGDNLIAASPLRELKREGYMIEVITSDPQSVVFENNPYIDKLTIKNAREIPQGDPVEWQKYWWARSCEYAKFINLSHSVEVLMANFQQSTSFWWPAEFRRKQFGGSYLEMAHDIVGVKHDFGPLFFPTPREIDDIADFKHRHHLHDKPLVGWVIAGTRIDKLYPYSGMAISRLLAEVDCNVIMMSAPSPSFPDAGHAAAIMEHVKLNNSSTDGLFEARHIEGVHDWSIRRMLTLARFCDLVIGPDTGVMWAVALENVPKIVLHSHASADNITKHWRSTISLHPDQRQVPCWPCHLLHDKIETCYETQMRSGIKIPDKGDPGAACISGISVDALLSAAKGMLDPAGGKLSRLVEKYSANTTVR